MVPTIVLVGMYKFLDKFIEKNINIYQIKDANYENVFHNVFKEAHLIS